jgi:hypothetical protein
MGNAKGREGKGREGETALGKEKGAEKLFRPCLKGNS